MTLYFPDVNMYYDINLGTSNGNCFVLPAVSEPQALDRERNMYTDCYEDTKEISMVFERQSSERRHTDQANVHSEDYCFFRYLNSQSWSLDDCNSELLKR